MALDENKLHDFLGRALVDLGGAINAVLMSIGDALGLYKALAAGPQSPAELADNTNTNERYIREWLNSQAAGGYVLYDKATGKCSLSEEEELCLVDGVEVKLRNGAKAADVGCGHGASTILLAKAFPKSEFVGYYYHGPSIETATQ